MRKGESIDFPPLPDYLTHKFSKTGLELFRPITLNNQRIGVVYIKRDLLDLYEGFWNYALIVILVLFLSLIVAMFSSTQIQRILTKPIDELVQSARTIIKKKDYSIRAKKISRDELGILTDVFNNMLQQI